MKWKKVLTRPYTLIMAYYSQTCYPEMPFPIENDIIVGRDGVITRYLDEDELAKLFSYIKTNKNSLKKYFQKGLEVDRELKKIIKKDPLNNFNEFHKKYSEYWVYCLFAYWTGQVLNEREIKPIKKEVDFIRGTKTVKNEIEESYFNRLLNCLEDKTKIAAALLSYATPEEIIANKFNLVKLKGRKKIFVWIKTKNTNRLCVGKEAEKIIGKELCLEKVNYSSIREVKGVPAYSGNVRGVARILLNPKDVNKVKKGDVLITFMTNPQFSVAMNKASAWVTDEGGLTCHAAIIARETSKVCIVGAKIATKVFKDGDRVEVDATKGTIKKLN